MWANIAKIAEYLIDNIYCCYPNYSWDGQQSKGSLNLFSKFELNYMVSDLMLAWKDIYLIPSLKLLIILTSPYQNLGEKWSLKRSYLPQSNMSWSDQWFSQYCSSANFGVLLIYVQLAKLRQDKKGTAFYQTHLIEYFLWAQISFSDLLGNISNIP